MSCVSFLFNHLVQIIFNFSREFLFDSCVLERAGFLVAVVFRFSGGGFVALVQLLGSWFLTRIESEALEVKAWTVLASGLMGISRRAF